MIVDLLVVYKILKKLTRPFDKWKAFDDGIIDAKGKILMKSRERKEAKLTSFTKLDLLVLRLKILINKQPLTAKKISTMAAALWLIREGTDIDENLITEETFEEYLMECIQEEGEPPTNNTSNVSGADGTEPGVSKKKQKEIQNGAKEKVLRNIITRV